MRRLRKLSEAAKTISPQAKITFQGIPDRDDWWVCIIAVGDAILVQSAAGPLDSVLNETTRKLQGMSQRIRAVLAPHADSVPPPPDSDTKDPRRDP